MRYTIQISGTGCFSAGNVSRCEGGQEAEEHTADTLDEAIRTVGLRSAEIFDEWGDLVATVEGGHATDVDGYVIEQD